MGKNDVGVMIPVLSREFSSYRKVKMRLHLISQDEGFVRCIDNGPHVSMVTITGLVTANKTISADIMVVRHPFDYQPEYLEEVNKDKRAMNILFNGINSEMFECVMNSPTAKDKSKNPRSNETVDYKKKYFDLLRQKEREFTTKENDWADGNDSDDEDVYMNLALITKDDGLEVSPSSTQVIITELSNLSQGSLSIDKGFHGHSKDLSWIKSFKEGYQTHPKTFTTPSRSGKFSTRYTVVVIGTLNPEVEEQQRDDILLGIGDQIVDPIERPNTGPDDVHIEDVAVEDVVLEGIIAEKDAVKNPDKNE
ncbi:hypothetical protein AgCh_016477 [Apium graveolens]